MRATGIPEERAEHLFTMLLIHSEYLKFSLFFNIHVTNVLSQYKLMYNEYDMCPQPIISKR